MFHNRIISSSYAQLLLAASPNQKVDFTHGRLSVNVYSTCARDACICNWEIVHAFGINDQNNAVNHEKTKIMKKSK